MTGEMAEVMRNQFNRHLEVPQNFQSLPAREISEEIGAELDGFGFGSGDLLIFVDCRNLPEEFFIHVLKRGEGEVHKESSHESKQAAKRVRELMQEYGA